jgi:uridine kinase
MAIRGTTLVAVEGTHATGKTTLVHALTAHYRRRSVNVACSSEPARTSPFIEEIVLHGKGAFDLATEVDLFAAQLQETLPTREGLLQPDQAQANPTRTAEARLAWHYRVTETEGAGLVGGGS